MRNHKKQRLFKSFSEAQARKLLPKRLKSSHKADAGRALIVAGSQAMYGAAVLAATGASRAGAGYVYLATKKSKRLSYHAIPRFFIGDYNDKNFLDKNFDSVAIGPGLGKGAVVLRLLRKFFKNQNRPLVVDADALNLCAQFKLFPFPSKAIATPHEAELGRLLNVSAEEIQKNRKFFADKAQKKLGCVLLLKGHHTLVLSRDEAFEIKSGNASLAKAGTGDVLTGIICAFLAQGLSPIEAAALGAFVHGRLADEWVKKKDVLSLMPSDLLLSLAQTLRSLRRKTE